MRAVGLMSGTSMDGVDAAIIDTDGRTIDALGATAFLAYPPEAQAELRARLGCWPGARLAPAHRHVLHLHAQAVAALPKPDVVGFHGQTLAHDPANARTHQLGDGAALARLTGCKVVWDFRSADMAAGGQGAPLVPLYHHALARFLGLTRRTVFLNLGGVANISIIEPNLPDGAPGAVAARDTGPASALLDDFMRTRLGRPYDENGALAASGQVQTGLVSAALADPWFARTGPKSADRNQFHGLLAQVQSLPDADAAATLSAFTAASIALAAPDGADWLVMGGGRRNATLMALLAQHLGQTPRDIDALGLNGDMIEAQAFGYLAVRVLHGLPTSLPSTTGCARPVCGGRIAA
ncbi:anhydro-N-acetylmuramic acid kinase [Abyssibius alkaniclasticus]|uniref:anhydro-N-acetylmuramic acid kinase n=1 Tax=Abyssibius alkaniclasticus TaxID=2881234 RepID=UPI0023638E3D|nr:anhydro-N-acetylmuramic acid kinase [Abyssibius alkaniclasticus]UPH70551.1 anhydro-N-acetylmuramic acid kinase [Abyssibius alkaniclasticus]